MSSYDAACLFVSQRIAKLSKACLTALATTLEPDQPTFALLTPLGDGTAISFGDSDTPFDPRGQLDAAVAAKVLSGCLKRPVWSVSILRHSGAQRVQRHGPRGRVGPPWASGGGERRHRGGASPFERLAREAGFDPALGELELEAAWEELLPPSAKAEARRLEALAEAKLPFELSRLLTPLTRKQWRPEGRALHEQFLRREHERLFALMCLEFEPKRARRCVAAGKLSAEARARFKVLLAMFTASPLYAEHLRRGQGAGERASVGLTPRRAPTGSSPEP